MSARKTLSMRYEVVNVFLCRDLSFAVVIGGDFSSEVGLSFADVYFVIEILRQAQDDAILCVCCYSEIIFESLGGFV